MRELLSLALKGAAAGVNALHLDFMHDAKVIQAENKDIKTFADMAAQQRVLNVLQTSGIPVLAEEGARESSMSKERIWLVDPLDGTFNFFRGFPIAAVSIALWEDGKPLLGVVHDVFSGDVFSASSGSGAWLGNRKLQVSAVKCKEQAVLATGFPTGRDYSAGPLMQFIESIQQFKKVRILGWAAMMLAQVAAGRFDVYEEEDIYLRDVAAGLALVQAAGGRSWLDSRARSVQTHVRVSNGHL